MVATASFGARATGVSLGERKICFLTMGKSQAGWASMELHQLVQNRDGPCRALRAERSRGFSGGVCRHLCPSHGPNCASSVPFPGPVLPPSCLPPAPQIFSASWWEYLPLASWQGQLPGEEAQCQLAQASALASPPVQKCFITFLQWWLPRKCGSHRCLLGLGLRFKSEGYDVQMGNHT